MSERHCRQFDILKPSNLSIHIAGAGGGGSWACLTLAKMGYENITVYDYDLVEDHNVSTQFFKEGDVGKSKVEALKENVKAFSGVDIVAVNGKADGSIKGDILIMAVDSMAGRKELSEAIPNFGLTIDPRAGGEIWRIWSVMSWEKAKYDLSWYSDDEAVHDPCTAKAIAYNMVQQAGYIGNIVKRFDLGEAIPFEINSDFKNLKLITFNS